MQFYYELISEGDRYYARVLRAIRQARESIQLMVYIWQNDEIGQLFLRALEHKCRQNVSVIVVIDAVGSYKLPDNFFRKLQDAGAQVYIHHHFRAISWQWFRFLIRRNHRKIIIVDNEIAFTGGFNIMRECSRRFFGDRRWLDLALVSYHAGFVRELQMQFQDACRRASHVKWARRQLLRSRNRVILISRHRAASYSMSRYLKRRLRRARQKIVIAVPYFVPYGFYYRIFKRKLKQGVRGEIILPETSDVPWVDGVSFYLARRLLKYGASIYLYHGPASERRFSHTKFYMLDGNAGTGSANYDYRSMVLNLDTLVFTRADNQQWQQMLDHLRRYSRVAAKADLKPGFFSRFLLPFRWIL